MITGGGKFSWLKAGARRPAVEWPLVPCWAWFNADPRHQPFLLNCLWFRSCEIRKQAEKLSVPLRPYPAGCLSIAQRSFYPALAPAWPCIAFKFQGDQTGWHRVTGMFVLFLWMGITCDSCGSRARAIGITVRRRVVGVADLTCLANLWYLWFICSGKNDSNVIRIFEYKTNLIVNENQVVPAVLAAFLQCFFWSKPLLYVHKDLWICLKRFYYVLLKLQSRCKAMELGILLEEFTYTSNHAYMCHFSFYYYYVLWEYY